MSKTTGKSAAKKASVTLSNSPSANAKRAAASALSQTAAPNKVSSAKAATAASKVLRNPNASAKAKSAAASTLSQRERRK